MSTAARTGPRRERARAATIAEIKDTARALMRESGTVDVRFSDIARAMEMTPPALYRYFADRDDLLSALIADAFDDLARAVAQARDSVPADDLPARWVAAARGYRGWARREPQQFALIFGLPLPGYSAPEDGPTTEAAQRAMAQLAALFGEAIRHGILTPPTLRDVDPALELCAVAKGEDLGGVLPPETFQAMLHAWNSVHGFTCLEAYGHYDWMEPAAREAFFLSQVRLAALNAGLPAP
ncbi:AcrR family transcriptional regulator [Kineococcus xinjiangensis]|uniref:AcrR family transcriptional regulator n=1 Tax=Kineococcus xinjiangensis TaxID=512762 RepID=A0A2S6IV96_9ACTN|nr:TetR/AcrR family transcriptional regulator [Kineococcus xinjiangensis]PPK98073.1 AcrR family transcriptional regulator [Kineococcus xinjiangensis]